MKHGFTLGVLLAGWLLTLTPAASGAVNRVFMFGRDYVRLDEWARTQRFTFRWTHADPPAPITAPLAHQMTRLNTPPSSRTQGPQDAGRGRVG